VRLLHLPTPERKVLTMAATSMSEADFVDRLAANLGEFEYVGGVRGAKMWLKEFKRTLTECVAEGNKVNLSGLLKIEPRYVAEKPAGEMVRNPGTGETAPRPETVPATFKAKATASASIKKAFPPITSSKGKALAETLA
jgi:nucleoid DNA-binding protein